MIDMKSTYAPKMKREEWTARQERMYERHLRRAKDRKRAIITASLRAPIELAPTWGEGPRARTLGDCVDLDEKPEHRWTMIEDKSARMRDRMRAAQNGAGRLCVWNNVSESRGRTMDDKAPTLTTKCGSQLYLLDGDRARILNPRELARMQSFPDSYQLPKQRGLAGKLIGNAIDVDLARGVCAQVVA